MPLTRPTLTYLRERGVRDGSSPRSGASQSESSYTRKFFCRWSERFDVVKYFLGYSALNGTTAAPVRLQRLTPLPYGPEDPLAFATRINVLSNHKIIGKQVNHAPDGATLGIYDQVEIEVVYERLPFRVLEDADVPIDDEYLRYVEVGESTVTGNYIQLPAGSMKYVSATVPAANNKIVPFGAGYIAPTIDLPMTWHDLPANFIDWDAAVPCPWLKRVYGDGAQIGIIGTINKTAFKTFAPGRLLLLKVAVRPRPIVVNNPDWNIGSRYNVHFQFSGVPTPLGWNALYYHDVQTAGEASGWAYVGRGANPVEFAPGNVPDNASLYNERDFKLLFKLPL